MLQPVNLADGTVACPDCREPVYDSGCQAPGCNGWGCPDCGSGCDLEFVSADMGGQCSAYADGEDAVDEYLADEN